MGSILLATDGSDHAREAAKRAIDLADEAGATLHVICVVDRRRYSDPAISSAELATIYADDHAVTCTKEVQEMAAERGVRVESDVRHGLPHETIVEYANEIDADTIVIGEHGDHDEHLPGVGREVAATADRDVIVVAVTP